MTGFVVGLDGGGTRTRAIVLDADGRERGVVEGEAGLVDPRDPREAGVHIATVARESLTAAGASVPAASLWAGLAGAGEEEVRRAVENAIVHEGVADRVAVGTDVEAAFHDAFGGGPGILLISGTGSCALGVGMSREKARAGGWGAVLGDEGSGYHLGFLALRSVVRAEDGREPPTALRAEVLGHLDLSRVGDLVAWAAGAAKADIAQLAPLVATAAEAGDERAAHLVLECVRELKLLVCTVRDRLGPWEGPPSVALAGGAVGERGALRGPLAAALESDGVRVTGAPCDPARGAADLALKLL